jgi:hypothetical protein
MNYTCGDCKNFIGAGDWDLCCMKGVRRLCYKNTERCDEEFTPKERSPILDEIAQALENGGDADGHI